jgi:uncharacterized coiled-coil protein SlyX
MAHLTNLA